MAIFVLTDIDDRSDWLGCYDIVFDADAERRFCGMKAADQTVVVEQVRKFYAVGFCHRDQNSFLS